MGEHGEERERSQECLDLQMLADSLACVRGNRLDL